MCLAKLTKFWNKKIKQLDWMDIGLIKTASAAFFLTVAKLWTPLLSLDWYWYGLIFIVTAIRPMYKAYLK